VAKDRFVNRLIREDDGQDVVEYALLAAIIAAAAVLVIPALTAKLGNAFTTGGQNVNNNWVPDPPQ
jgi:pilus assembly protein Flp/PilA